MGMGMVCLAPLTPPKQQLKMLSQLLWHKNVLLRVAKSLAYINYTRLSNRQNAGTQLCDNDGLHCLKGRVGEEKEEKKEAAPNSAGLKY